MSAESNGGGEWFPATSEAQVALTRQLLRAVDLTEKYRAYLLNIQSVLEATNSAEGPNAEMQADVQKAAKVGSTDKESPVGWSDKGNGQRWDLLPNSDRTGVGRIVIFNTHVQPPVEAARFEDEDHGWVFSQNEAVKTTSNRINSSRSILCFNHDS